MNLDMSKDETPSIDKTPSIDEKETDIKEEENHTNKECCSFSLQEIVKKNRIRQVNTYIQPYLHLRVFDIAIGMYYSFIHVLIIVLSGIILLFSNNLIYLACLLVVISFDAFSIVMLHDCPLTQLEKKYLNLSGRKKRTHKFINAGIMYECLHEYEHQIELLVNVWSMIACKMLVLMCLKMFNININIY
jgi:hypothetical protein